MRRRWLFADQLGPHFLDVPHQQVLLIESKAVFRRRAFHRQKAHLVLSALRHRAAELGDSAVHVTAETYRHALRRIGEPLDVCHPTSRRARDFVRAQPGVVMLPPRGFVTSSEDFAAWADSQRGTMRLENFYRYARRRHRVLMDGDEPAGGRWREGGAE
ncbi:cryptochrome/photolyase family protein, partial [Micromonospora sp. CPCC 205371]|nr:cryptochrome/photolyase family protein [Micromonospora sp. CPCC 205371]